MEGKRFLRTVSCCLLCIGLVTSLVSCGSQEATSVTVQGSISEDTTWTADNIYVLNQETRVINGATLTIEPGTLIKAAPGEFPNASMLLITQGSKINAVGTPEKPIVFTSSDDNITRVEESNQSLLNENNKGLWGGIIILGTAPISTETGDVSTFYVGLDPSDKANYYGGTNVEDNSGIMKYVSIRYGGTYMGTGSESNGLTLCGVGNKTQIDQIEVYANQDDGIEFFGGTVNASNLLVYNSGDDGIDLDEGYSGEIKNIMVVLGEQSDSGIEISGGQGDFQGDFSLSNIQLTVQTPSEDQQIMRIDSASKGSISTLLASNFLDISKIQLQSSEVTLQQLQISKNQTEVNSLSEINGGEKNSKNISFSSGLSLENDSKGYHWTLTKQMVSR
ncbi:MAG: hypothetical protein P8O04_05040 [Flavobacteriaceae bacterium]|nr:hypothetical protein [Flavobacteriaceae bacterium]